MFGYVCRYEDPVADILIGLLRLRQVSNVSFRPEMVGKRCSIVRELHVYGSAVPLQVLGLYHDRCSYKLKLNRTMTSGS